MDYSSPNFVGQVLSGSLATAVLNTLIFGKGTDPVALFNVRPLFHYNIIQISLIQRMVKLTKSGIKCSIILYDKTTLHGEISDEIATENEVNNAMDLFFDTIIKCGVKPYQLEVIPESIIWKFSGFKENFLPMMLQLVHSSANIDLNNSVPQFLRATNISYYFDVLLGLLYEALLKPDFVLTAGEEIKTIWSSVRARKNLSSVFGSGYLSPVMLRMPDLYKYDNHTVLINTMSRDDPYCSLINDHELNDMLNKMNENYKKRVIEINSINPITHSNDPKEIIYRTREKIYG